MQYFLVIAVAALVSLLRVSALVLPLISALVSVLVSVSVSAFV